jgi:hypothetical protein
MDSPGDADSGRTIAMSDKQPNPAPDEKPAESDPLAALSGNSIDDLLAEAETLASKVAHEVGAGDRQPPVDAAAAEPPHDADATEEPPAPDTAEAAVTAMETILADGEGKEQVREPDPPSEEVGETPAIDSQVVEAPPGEGGTAAEPIEPEPETSETAATTWAREDSSPEPPSATVEETPVTADDHAVVEEEIAAAASEPSPLPAAADSAQAPPERSQAGNGRWRRMLRRVTRGLTAGPRLVISSPYWLLAGVLWLIDLPFGWMSPSLKEMLGYIGVVTAVMAAVAWAMVLLGIRG